MDMTRSPVLSEPHSPSRCVELNDWRSFATPLLLEGWEERSVWGFDQCHAEFFGCLWPNGADAPIRVSDRASGCPRGHLPGEILLAVHDHIESDPLVALVAMGLVDPERTLRPPEELRRRLGVDPPAQAGADYARGSAEALRWLNGTRHTAPGSRHATGGEPVSAGRALAEMHLLEGMGRDTARLARQLFNGGAVAAIGWAIGEPGYLDV